MSKVRIVFILCILILFAVVAVFSDLGAARSSQLSTTHGASLSSTPTEILTADGTDPQPPPRPLPWLGVAS